MPRDVAHELVSFARSARKPESVNAGRHKFGARRVEPSAPRRQGDAVAVDHRREDGLGEAHGRTLRTVTRRASAVGGASHRTNNAPSALSSGCAA